MTSTLEDHGFVLSNAMKTLRITDADKQDPKWEPVMERFKKFLDEDPKLVEDLDKSVEKAIKYDIKEMKQLCIIDRWSFMVYMNKLLRWTPEETFDGKDVFYHLVMFYFVLNQPPFGNYQTAILPENYGKISWMSQWLVDYARAVGAFCDKPESLTEEQLKTFHESPNYKMSNYIEPRGGWKTFNQFFARSFKPGYRTVYGLNDPTVLVSPADSTYNGAWDIDLNCNVTLKHLQWTISELLQGSRYAHEFSGGVFTHSFLGPTDYHRLHAPVEGKVLESRVIEGQCYLETEVINANELGQCGTLVASRKVDAPDAPGYQFVHTRGLTIIDSPIGLVAVLPVGMATVSSVNITAEVGITLRKGEEIGYFQFGGSDIVTVYQKKSKVALTAVDGLHLSMGMPIGTAKVQP
jgi:phosphatidylserine decarboxylase